MVEPEARKREDIAEKLASLGEASPSSQAPYLSLPRKRTSSLDPLLLLSAKDQARLTCSVANALTTVR